MSEAYFSHGCVGHSRMGLRKNSFRYPVFSFLFRCADEVTVGRALRHGFGGLLRIKAKDYLDGSYESFDEGIRSFLQTRCHYQAEEVWLQTFPRMFGYVFNPVSFWLCKKESRLEAVLVEVNNTFGERHFYWLHTPGQEIQSDQWLRAEKVFHVSPFFPVEGHYKFRFQISDKMSRVDINYFCTEDSVSLITWIEGALTPLAAQSKWVLLLRYGWMTLLVTIRIHWQALRLWRKKVSFFNKPAPPSQEIT